MQTLIEYLKENNLYEQWKIWWDEIENTIFKWNWEQVDQCQFYQDTIHGLFEQWKKDNRIKFELAKDSDDYAKITLWIKWLWKLITHMHTTMLNHIAVKEWWENSHDVYAKEFWLPIIGYEKVNDFIGSDGKPLYPYTPIGVSNIKQA